MFSDGLSWAHRRSAARGRGELGWPAGVWAMTTVSQWCVSAVWYADRHVGIDTLVPPLHLINGCVRKQPPFQAPQIFQNKQLLLSGLLSIRAAPEDERARARSFSPVFAFPVICPSLTLSPAFQSITQTINLSFTLQLWFTWSLCLCLSLKVTLLFI